MRISDWSSDVCSSDLRGDLRRAAEPGDRLDRIFELEVLDAFLFEILGGRRKARIVLGVLGQDRVVGLDLVDQVAAQDVFAKHRTRHVLGTARLEERREGKACVSNRTIRWSKYHLTKKQNNT